LLEARAIRQHVDVQLRQRLDLHLCFPAGRQRVERGLHLGQDFTHIHSFGGDQDPPGLDASQI
jgi:hypothetical protein